jgi:dTDP-4-amino-4,6-dideoxygalactose transaminase
MRIGRTVPPAAAPLCWSDLWRGVAGIVSRGRSIRRLEEEIRRDFAVKHVFLVSSGTAALTLTLAALKSLSPRKQIVLPAYTCFSVPAAVLKANLTPALCDINPATFDFHHALLEQTLSRDTLAVIAHHLFGVPSDVERTKRLCQARGIFVVEDAAQAMGVECNGRTLGLIGDVGIFSLGRGKNITCGSGGIIVTNSAAIAAAIERRYRQLSSPALGEVATEVLLLSLMSIFIRPRLYWIPAALPFLRLGQTIFPTDIPMKRLSGMKAGLLRNWRIHLTQANRIRSETAAYFSAQLSLRLAHGKTHPYLRLPILATDRKERDRIYSQSQQRGLGVSVAYPTPINEVPELRTFFDGQRFPSARKVADSLLTLPTHQWVSEIDKRAITQLCRAQLSRDLPAA